MFRFANSITLNPSNPGGGNPNPGNGGGTTNPPNPSVLVAPRTGLGFASVAPLNWQDFFENTYIPGSTAEKTRSNQTVIPSLAGGYRTVAVDGNLDWYFSNIAMIHYVGTPNYTYTGDLGTKNIDVQARIKSYINLYLSNIDSQNTIQNKTINGTTVTNSRPDSHDSYISTTLTLSAYYHATYVDTGWWTNKLPTLKVLADTLISNLHPTYNLSPNFFYQPPEISSGYQPQFYFEDNLETLVGLFTFSRLLEQLGDTSYTIYRAAADNVKNAITNSLYKPSASRFDISIEKSPVLGYVWQFNSSVYYPNWQAQAFPYLYDSVLTPNIVASAWNTFITGQPQTYWDSASQTTFKIGSGQIEYPEGLLAMAGAKNGLTQSTKNIIQRVESQRQSLGYVTITDVASAAKAKQILSI